LAGLKFEHESEIQLIILLGPKRTEEQFSFQWVGWAGKEQRVISLQQRRRRLAVQGIKCSWFGKPGRRRWLGRPQVNPVALLQETTGLLSSVDEVLLVEGLGG
jgi:hypothetical protein